MSTIKLMVSRGRLSKRTLLNFILIITALLLITAIYNSTAEDDDEDDDEFEDIAGSLGWASVGLFVISTIYVIFYLIFKLSRKITDESRLIQFKKNYTTFFWKIRKPFLYIHYISGLLALGVLIAHGLLLTNGDTDAIIGWITAGIYIFYILSGLLLWFKIIHPKRNKKLRKAILYIHRSLILFVIAVVIHIVHLAISD